MPSATAREFQRVARIIGFVLVKQKVSHADGTIPTDGLRPFPVHGGEEIGPPLFNKILRQLGIIPDEFRSFARSKIAFRFC